MVNGANPQSAGAFRFIAPSVVVAYRGTNGLWISHNLGQRWRRELPGWDTSSVAAEGRTLWVVAAHCMSGSCRPQLLKGDEPWSSITPIAAQPVTPGALSSVLALSAQATAVTATNNNGDTDLLVTTDDGGSWQDRAFPCPAAKHQPQLSSAGGVLWLVCLSRQLGPAPGEGSHLTFRSLDSGATWHQMTPKNDVVASLAAFPVSATAAWGEEQSLDSPGLLRTVNGGRHWAPVRTPWPDSTFYLALAAISPDKVWCLAQGIVGQGWRFSIYTTADAGKHWAATPLPIPKTVTASATRK